MHLSPVTFHMGFIRTICLVNNLFAGSSLLIVSCARALRDFVRNTQSVLKTAAIRTRRLDLRATLVDGLVVVKSVRAMGVLFFDIILGTEI